MIIMITTNLIKWAVMEMQKVRIGMDGKYSGFDAIAFDANNPKMNLAGWKMNNKAENRSFCKRIVICEPVCMGFFTS